MRNIQWQMCIFMCMLMAKYTNGFIGVNWGKAKPTEGAHIPSVVVDLLLRNEVTDTRLFTNGEIISQPFTNTGINISISFRNEDINKVRNVDDAKKWLDPITLNCTKLNIPLRYIMVSNDPFAPSKGKPLQEVVDILNFLSQGIAKGSNQNQAKVTIPHSTDVLKNVKKPSEGEFKDEIKDIMKRTLNILQQYKAPFVLEIMPLELVKQMSMDSSFASYQGNVTIADVGFTYKNAFEFWYDACKNALKKLGAPDVKIVVGKIGWPTDGSADATPEKASQFYKGFLSQITSGKGTPANQGVIDAYLETLIDENLTMFPVSKNMGIFNFDGTPKFPIDFSGQGQPTVPYPAAGINHLPMRYCIYRYTAQDTTRPAPLVNGKKWIDQCSQKGLCSSLQVGGSCSNESDTLKVSYALNMLYQESKQTDCSFDNLGKIVYPDPSTTTCKFLLEVLAGEMFDKS